MQRRTVIKQLAFATGAILLVPSCMEDKGKASILLKKISIDGKQETMLAELAETIIPKTGSPGAKDISAHLFALKMVDDCYKKEDQEKFIEGLEAFQTKVKKDFGKTFNECNAGERKQILTTLEDKKTGDEKLAYFYSTIKRLTIQAYTTSKFYLTNIQVYKLVPGKYHGCVPVKNVA